MSSFRFRLSLIIHSPSAARTALELQGYAHYLARKTKEIHLYGPKPPAHWLSKLPLKEQFVYHNSASCFAMSRVHPRWRSKLNVVPLNSSLTTQSGFKAIGSSHFPHECAILKVLIELPGRENFHQSTC